MGIVRWWLGLTAIVLLGILIWAFVPILVPVLAIAAALGALASLVVGLARRLERSRADGSLERLEPTTEPLPRRLRRRSELPD
jgi:hypothetical protein